MSEPVGGYIFVPTTPPVEVLHGAMAALARWHDRFEIYSPTRRGGAGPFLGPFSVEEAYRELQGIRPADLRLQSISATLADYGISLDLRDDDRAYVALLVMVSSRSAFLDEMVDPASVELFAARWVALCEALHARFGFFAGIPVNTLDTSTLSQVLSLLSHEDAAALVETRFWRGYLGAQLAARLGDETPIPPGITKAVRLPTGALVAHGDPGYNPIVGPYDLERQATWILAGLRGGPQVPGVPELVADVQQNLAGPIRALDTDQEALEQNLELARAQRPNARRWELRAEIGGEIRVRAELLHAALDQIRALWAVARDRPGLAGINRPLPFHEANGVQKTLIVPIIAGEGKEWIDVSLHDPHALKEPFWTEPKEPIEARASELMAAARHHHVLGQPPRVVIFFWYGVLDETRTALERLGVRIEVAAQSVPLLTP